jgi:hypothetical protein
MTICAWLGSKRTIAVCRRHRGMRSRIAWHSEGISARVSPSQASLQTHLLQFVLEVEEVVS